MENCIFCKILAGEIPSKRHYEDDDMIIIEDINPQARKHYLCVIKQHFKLLADMNEVQSEMLLRCLKKIPCIATEKLGLDNGYRLIINQGEDAGQTIFHLHIHILGGEDLGERIR